MMNSLMKLGLLNKLINFALLCMAEFDHFDTFPGWVGGAKLRLNTNKAQLKLKLGQSLAKSAAANRTFHRFFSTK